MPHDARKNNAPIFSLTRFTNQNGEALTKSISLGPDGVPVSTAAAQMYVGAAEHIKAEGLAGVAKIIESCESSQCLSLGVIHKIWRPSAGQTVRVVTKKTLAEKPDETQTLSRAREPSFRMQTGWGFSPGDHDRKGISKNVETLLAFSGGVMGALCEVFPQLKNARRIVRASTSAGTL